MRFLGIILSVHAFFLGSLLSQSATEMNEGKRIVYDESSNTYTISWWGRTGFTYFLQESEDLENWSWCPVVQQPQADGASSEQFTASTSSRFFRLVFSDDPDSYLFTDDFDGDRISNGDEIAGSTDPFQHEVIVDSDLDTLPDYWESFYFGDQDESDIDSDNDGLLNSEEFTLGTDPSHFDTDQDGTSDGIEEARGSDPKSPFSGDATLVPAVATELLIFSPTR